MLDALSTLALFLAVQSGSDLGLGDDAREIRLPLPAEGLALRVAAASAEPLTVIVESFDADVSVRVENERGDVLASDADSGVETNAWLSFTPASAAPVTIRVLADAPGGALSVAVVRGAVDPTPPHPDASARTYWRRALARARERGDDARADVASNRLAALGVRADDGPDGSLRDARAALEEARVAREAKDVATARARVARAVDLLAGESAGDEDPFVADLAREAGAAAEALGDVRAQLAGAEIHWRFCERTFADEHPFLQNARVTIGTLRHRVGRPESARPVLEKAVRIRTRQLPEGHPKLLNAQQNLAIALGQTGDLVASRALFERVLVAREKTLPPDDRLLVAARRNYAISIALMGDLEGARVIEESVIAALERTMPPEDPALLDALYNHASTLSRLGRHEAARAIGERILPIQERRLSPDDSHLQHIRQNLAGSLWLLGRREEARKLFDAAFASLEKTHEHDIMLQAQRLNLAALLQEGGELAAARPLEEKALDELVRAGAHDHPELGRARALLHVNLRETGDAARADALLDDMIAAASRRASRGETLSRREAGAAARAVSRDVAFLLAAETSGGGPRGRAVYALDETVRILGSGDDPARLAVSADPTLEKALGEVGETRRRAAELGARIGQLGASAPPGAVAALAEAAAARDRAEQAFRGALAERGVRPVSFDAAALARALPEDAAAVSYRRFREPYAAVRPRKDGAAPGEASDWLVAHVLRRDGSLARIDLGRAAPIEAAVESWRASIGCPVSGGGGGAGARGIGATAPAAEAAASRASGEAVRRAVLDPVLAAAGGATTLFACLDDFLHVTPLDALPLGDGTVGDRAVVRVETSFARLLSPREAPAGELSMLLVGGIEFDAERAPSESPVPRLAGALAPPIGFRVGASLSHFASLPGARVEIDSVARVFSDRLGTGAVILDGPRATKDALASSAPRARLIHVATHGYFAAPPEAPAGGPASLTPEDAAASLLPLTLCGIALAGANRGMEADGRVPGILTAEELASLDLRACDLAVLSACDGSAGIRRAGEGVQSLRAALHAAGARSTVTSLWPVADEDARALMVDFYRRLLVEGRPRSVALWEAKRAMRDAGRPVAAWAGWVLTGEDGAVVPRR